jgi:hypothetical protein
LIAGIRLRLGLEKNLLKFLRFGLNLVDFGVFEGKSFHSEGEIIGSLNQGQE